MDVKLVVVQEDINMAPITKKHVENLEEENLNQKVKVEAEPKAEAKAEVEVLQEEQEKYVENVDVKSIFHKQLYS